jgi:pSer/pThr/pTyr-binding forkhead associated (FHA) protein
MKSKSDSPTQISASTFLPVKALFIEAYDGAKLVSSAKLENQSIIIGRIMSADFKISDPRVSRFHALIERLEDGQIKITDLGSSQGTFVNGQKIVEKIISTQDEVSLAILKLKISWTTVIPEALRDLHSAENRTLTPAPIQNSKNTPSMDQATVVESQKKELTQVSSLKEIARTRGVLDKTSAGVAVEITVYWENTILAVDHFRDKAKELFVGSEASCQYLVPDSDLLGRFKFLEIENGTATLFLHSQFKGSVRTQKVMRNFDELRSENKASVRIQGDDLAKIQIGTVNFFIMLVPEAPRVPTASLIQREPFFWFIQFSLFLTVGLVLTLAYLNQDPIEGKVVEFPEKLRKILIQEYKKEIENKIVNQTPPEVLPETKVEPTESKKGAQEKKAETVPDAQIIAKEAKAGGNEGEGMKEKGPEGKRGKPDAPNETGLTNRPKVAKATKTFDGPEKTKNPDKAPSPKAVVAPPDLLQTLKNSGLGSRIAKVSGSGFGGSGGEGGGAQGNDPLDEALSGVGGGGIRSGRGSGGSGLQGTGTGGGGTAVGVGGLGTKGFGGGAKGTGMGSLPGKGELLVGTETQEITVVGSLTREQIERVVNARMNEVRFCYQRELGRDPKLAGKIALQWNIISGGQVEWVKVILNSTGSNSLSQCLRDRLERWQFPSPTGGSSAVVEWPWNFKPSGT